MIRLNFIVEGSSEEIFVKNVLTPHFSAYNIYVAVRKIQTGWNNFAGKPAKGGMVSYAKFKNDILRWVKSDKCSKNCWYTTMVDLYKFPTDGDSPYTNNLANISDKYLCIETLEKAIADDLKIKQFIPYIQLHEFETFLMIHPERLELMYPESSKKIAGLKKDNSYLDTRTEADVTDLVENLGYKPDTPVQKGIERFIEWCKTYFTPWNKNRRF